jgi:hypothetical protein
MLVKCLNESQGHWINGCKSLFPIFQCEDHLLEVRYRYLQLEHLFSTFFIKIIPYNSIQSHVLSVVQLHTIHKATWPTFLHYFFYVHSVQQCCVGCNMETSSSIRDIPAAEGSCSSHVYEYSNLLNINSIFTLVLLYQMHNTRHIKC